MQMLRPAGRPQTWYGFAALCSSLSAPRSRLLLPKPPPGSMLMLCKADTCRS